MKGKEAKETKYSYYVLFVESNLGSIDKKYLIISTFFNCFQVTGKVYFSKHLYCKRTHIYVSWEGTRKNGKMVICNTQIIESVF